MSMNILLVLLLLAITATSSYGTELSDLELMDATAELSSNMPKVRTKRGIFWDFFQKMAITTNLAIDQYVDTRDTLNRVYNYLNEDFSDPAPSKPTLRPTSTKPTTASDDDDDDMTTTTESYQISRYELGRLLGQNFRGLQRLTQIELQDAFNQTRYNIREYKAEAKQQFNNSLAVEAKKKLKSIAG